MSVRKRTWTNKAGERKESWIVDYVDQEGDRHIETFDRKRDADARHDEVRTNVRKGTHLAPSKSSTVAEAAEAWIKRVEADGRERTTIRQYRQHAKMHIVPRIGQTKLAHLTPAKVESFRDELLAELSRPMARKVLTSLKSLLKIAKHAHVAADVSIGRGKRSERKLEIGRDIPTTDEIKRLIAAASDGKRRALLLTAALTGLRASELRGLRWRDVDLKAGTLTVTGQLGRDGTTWVPVPKTEASAATVPLLPVLQRELAEHRVRQAGRNLQWVRPDSLVFTTMRGKPQSRRNVLRAVHGAGDTLGLNGDGVEPVGLHDLRHSFVAVAFERNLTAPEIATLARHANAKVTLSVYAGLTDDGREKAIAKLAESGFGG
jgi:integrase